MVDNRSSAMRTVMAGVVCLRNEFSSGHGMERVLGRSLTKRVAMWSIWGLVLLLEDACLFKE